MVPPPRVWVILIEPSVVVLVARLGPPVALLHESGLQLPMIEAGRECVVARTELDTSALKAVFAYKNSYMRRECAHAHSNSSLPVRHVRKVVEAPSHALHVGVDGAILGDFNGAVACRGSDDGAAGSAHTGSRRRQNDEMS